MRWLIVVIAALGLAACGRDNQALGVERDRAPGAGTQVDQGQVDDSRIQPNYDRMPEGTRQGADSWNVDPGASQGDVPMQGDTQSDAIENEQRGGLPAAPDNAQQNSAAQPGSSIPEGGIEGVTPQSGTNMESEPGSGTHQHDVGSDRVPMDDGRTNTEPGSAR